MKTFREFLSEDAVKAQKAWQDWMNANPREFTKGGRFYERGGSTKTTQAAKDFMKTYMKTGKPPEGFEIKSTKVSGQNVRGGSTQTPPRSTQTPPKQQQQAPRQQPPQTPPKSTQQPPRQPSSAAPPPKAPTRNVPSTAAKPPTATPGIRPRFRGLGTAASGALEFASRKSEGQSTTRAAGGAVASSMGWMKGAQLGARVPGGPWAKAAGALVGGIAGETAASKAYDAISPKGPSEKDVQKATQQYGMRKARSQMSSANVYGAKKGSAITGLGGQTKVDKKSGTITTQGKTAKLGSTQLVRDPKSGKQVVGDLAYKGGKPVYIARPSTASRESNASPGSAWRNLQRSLNIGGQRERDVAAAKQEYRTALKNTQTYQKQLGISAKQATAQKLPGAGVGPKKVGPKLVGPKLVGPKIVGSK
jgi:hypothetical protein